MSATTQGPVPGAMAREIPSGEEGEGEENQEAGSEPCLTDWKIEMNPNQGVFMDVCIYVYICMCMYVCIYIYICEYM